MQVQCSECMKLHKYMIRVAKGVKWSQDPEGSMRYSSYANGMLEERYLCPPCLFIQLGISGAAKAPKGYYDEVKPDELQEDKDDSGATD